MSRLGVFALALAMCGCGALLPLTGGREGDCTLALRDGQGRDLEPPYRVALVPVLGGPPEASVMYVADGWESTTITVIDPAGGRTTGGFDAAAFNGDLTGSTFQRAGTWRVRLRTLGCEQAFDIEVAQPR